MNNIRPSSDLRNKYSEILLRTLAEADEDVVNGRVTPVKEVFSNIRKSIWESNQDTPLSE